MGLAPPGPSSAGWKTNLIVPLIRSLSAFIDRGGDQGHGRVAVMAAGVHDAGVLGSKGQPGCFGDGQRIHVCPDQQGRAGAAGVEQAHHTRAGDAGDHGEAFPFQIIGHIGAGLLFCECQFRYAV